MNAARVGERGRLVDAFTRVAAERGYADTTVEEFTARAGLSSDVFEIHFAGKLQCLVAAYDAFFERLLQEIKDAAASQVEWSLQVKAAVEAAFQFLTEAFGPARLFVVEAVSAGPAVLERYFALLDRIAAILRGGRRVYPQAAALPPEIESVLVSGSASLIAARLLSEEGLDSTSMAARVTELLVAPYVGRDEAARVATA